MGEWLFMKSLTLIAYAAMPLKFRDSPDLGKQLPAYHFFGFFIT